MRTVIALLLTALTACATQSESEDPVIVTPEKLAQCKSQGGCRVITNEALNELYRLSYEAGIHEAMKREINTCASNI
jgi:hypothetical protein